MLHYGITRPTVAKCSISIPAFILNGRAVEVHDPISKKDVDTRRRRYADPPTRFPPTPTRRHVPPPNADTLCYCYCQDFAVEMASSFAFLTVASRSAGAARVGSTKMLVTSVIPINPKTPPRVLLCRS
jgi:hypothetical protein